MSIFTQADTELKTLKDHHSALMKEKDNVVQAQLAQIQTYQQCYLSYQSYYQDGEGTGETSVVASDVMIGGDPNLSQTATAASMEVTESVAYTRVGSWRQLQQLSSS